MNPSQTIQRVYPWVMAFGFICFFTMIHFGLEHSYATYLTVISAASLITFLEFKFPHRRVWLSSKNDVTQDAIYMAAVQIVLPRILSMLVAFTLLETDLLNSSNLKGLWPHQLTTGFQTALMVLTADFFRYWLHRACHEWPLLWRLHAVHHSPHKLYWVNVARFHPIEKAIQYGFDAFPFILLGVSEEVMALYFIFYSINGFFQHCNIELRLGWLNYLVSGPELHRWHHSKIPEESNSNYGNNLIVWDLVFGTRFLPEHRLVGDLGLKNRAYPMGFIGQLKTPFQNGIENV